MRILFADDHRLVRQTVKQFLVDLDGDAAVLVDEADTLQDLMSYAGTQPSPDLILLDLVMPGMGGVQGIDVVKKAFPASRVIVLSGNCDHSTIVSSFKMGAAGFIPKTASREEFIAGLKLVLQGQRYVPGMLLDGKSGLPGAEAAGTSTEAIAPLSEREAHMLSMVADGKTNKEIAHHFTLEEVTIKLALKRIYKKLGARNRAAAVHLAIKSGIV